MAIPFLQKDSVEEKKLFAKARDFGGNFATLCLYTNEFNSWFLAASAWQQIFGLHSRLAIQQWSHPPDTKICAASLPNSQLLNSFVYIIDLTAWQTNNLSTRSN
jgi:hypothetical protein